MNDDLDAYLESEWRLYAADAGRRQIVLEASLGIDCERVLDVGCGGGQGCAVRPPGAS